MIKIKNKGTVHFQDGSTLEYKNTEIIYTDNGMIMNGTEGKIFIPYGSIKMISEKR